MLQVAGLVFPLFSLILIGYIAGRLAKLPLEGLRWMNFFIVYVALPAMFFQLLARTPIEEFGRLSFLVRTTLGTFLIFSACFLIARFLRRASTPEASIQGFAGAYGNIGYMGPPLAIAAFGPEAGVPVALVFCFDNTLHFVLAPLLMGASEPERGSMLALLGTIVKRILTHPFIIATIVGISAAWLQFEPPAPLDSLLARLANAAAPCALFVMGVTAALRPLKRVPLELTWLVPVKLLIHPLLIWLLIRSLPGIEPVWVHSAVLLAALPAATNVFVIAQQYGVWEERASSAVVIGTLCSVLTVTAYLYLVTIGAI